MPHKYKEDRNAQCRRHRAKNVEKFREKDRLYRLNNPLICKIRVREAQVKKRMLVLNHYGCKCQWPEGCDVTDPDMLQVDHINGGGNKHRKEINKIFFNWLIDNDFPPGFRLLCANHNVKHRSNLQREKREREG